MPRLAWRRILDRAQRGVGDASYDSDEEQCAQDEARDERPRGELARILTCIRDVRTSRGEISKPSERQTGTLRRDKGVNASETVTEKKDSIAAAEAELEIGRAHV